MIKESFFISRIIRFFTALWIFFEKSVYYKIFNKIGDFFAGLLEKSGIYAIFTRNIKDSGDSISGNFVNRIFGIFYKIFHGLFIKIRNASEGSAIVRFSAFMLNEWHKISVRYYGLFGFVFCCVRLAVNRQLSGMGVDTTTILLGGVSLVMMLFDVSLAGFYEGCGLKKLIGLGNLNIPLKTEVKNNVAVTASIILGAGLGVFSAVPLWYLLAAAVFGLTLIMIYPKLGVIMITAAFPVIPTMAVAGLAVLTMLAAFIKYLNGDREKITFDLFDCAILIMCAALVYGVVNSYSVKSSIPIAAIYLVFVSSAFVVRRALADERFLSTVLDSMIAVSAVVCLYGIYQLLSGQAATTWQDTEMFEEMSGRICSTFENPNVFGEYLLILIPITFGKLITSKPERKVPYLAVLALQLVNMILTYSRGCWIGMVAAMAIMLMMTGRKPLSVLALGIFALPFVLPQSIIDRIMSIGNTADSSTSYRVYIWEGTIKMLKDFWICGIGMGTDAFNSVYPRYALNAISAPHSHNLYLHIVCEMGIVGIAAVGGIIISFFRRVCTAAKNTKALRVTAVALATAMAGYLVQGMFDNVWYNYRIYMFFFIVIAIGGAIYDISKEKSHE